MKKQIKLKSTSRKLRSRLCGRWSTKKLKIYKKKNNYQTRGATVSKHNHSNEHLVNKSLIHHLTSQNPKLKPHVRKTKMTTKASNPIPTQPITHSPWTHRTCSTTSHSPHIPTSPSYRNLRTRTKYATTATSSESF